VAEAGGYFGHRFKYSRRATFKINIELDEPTRRAVWVADKPDRYEDGQRIGHGPTLAGGHLATAVSSVGDGGGALLGEPYAWLG
jgi:hypothetical protein